MKAELFALTVVAAVALLSVIIAPSLTTMAASVADMNQPNPSDNNNNNSTVATGANSITPQAGEKMILTATTSGEVIKPGKDAGLTVIAQDKNGTGIEGVDIQAQYTNYNNHTQKINLRGVTDKTGDFTTSTQIPTDSKTGQWLVVISGDKPGFKHEEISTGFTVSKSKGKDMSSSGSGGSSSSSGGKGKSGGSSGNGNSGSNNKNSSNKGKNNKNG